MRWFTQAQHQPLFTPAFSPAGHVYVSAPGSDDNATLYCLDGDTGAVRWTYVSPTGCCNIGSEIDDVVVGAAGGVFLTTYPGPGFATNITALDPDTGAVLWGYGLLEEGGDERLYLAHGGTVVVGVLPNAW